jgi:cation diffusion facilitator CzcD-associated flavoprotein CzcO
MKRSVEKAIVIGGGIGGLTAAIALKRAGIRVAVFEQAPEAEDPMDPGTRLEAGKPVDIKESPGFAHPGIVTGFAPREKPISARETEAFRTLRGSKLPTRFPEEPQNKQ